MPDIEVEILSTPIEVTIVMAGPQGPPGPEGPPSGGEGGGVTDGDKGDVVVSGSGVVWVIDNDAVSNAKAANMAESTIKGRAAAAGTGDPTDLTATQVRTIINVADGATANDTDANLKNRANHTGTQAASTISDFDTEVGNQTDVAANTTARHTHTNKALLDTYDQTNANIADAVTKKHAHANQAVLDATTASFLTAQETKLGFITVSQAVDLDAIETNANNVPGIKTKTDFITVTQAVDLDAIETNANNVPGIKTKTDHITVTQAVDLDTMESDIAGKQPLDSDLTSWAAITRAAGFDTFVATPTGANLAALITTALPASKGGTGLTALAANIVSLLGAADYAAVRTLLGLVIGTNVQAWDADLDTWAVKTAPSGVVIGTTDTQTLSNKRVTRRVTTETSSATPTINTDNTDIHIITAQTEAITSFTTNLSGTPTDGQLLQIAITGTAARAITWGASFEASTVALPTTTVSTARLDVGFIWNATASKWRCLVAV